MEHLRMDLSNSLSTLPSKLENSSVTQALTDRLLISEAIDLVGRMIAGYPNRGQADKSYIGAIAEILTKYPRVAAIQCMDPVHGVTRETKFLPTPGNIIPWLEDACLPLREQAAREKRIREQLEARDKWNNGRQPRQGGSSYKEFRKYCADNGLKPRPGGAFEAGGYLGPTK